MACGLLVLAPPVSATQPSGTALPSAAQDRCQRSFPRFAGHPYKVVEGARGSVSDEFGSLRWASDTLRVTLEAGYALEICVMSPEEEGMSGMSVQVLRGAGSRSIPVLGDSIDQVGYVWMRSAVPAEVSAGLDSAPGGSHVGIVGVLLAGAGVLLALTGAAVPRRTRSPL